MHNLRLMWRDSNYTWVFAKGNELIPIENFTVCCPHKQQPCELTHFLQQISVQNHEPSYLRIFTSCTRANCSYLSLIGDSMVY